MEYKLSNSVDGSNKIIVYQDSPLGRGATATVYKASINGRSYAAKIYTDKSKLNLKKIEAMIANPPTDLTGVTAGINYPRYSWPISIIEDDVGQALGYAMPIVDQTESFTLDHYYDKNLGKKLNSPDEVALSYKIEIAANLSRLIADLHSHGHYFIDFKPQNIRVFKRTHAVTLIDCDGFSIAKPGGESFPAELLSTDYISPEAFRGHKSAKELSEDQDRYALATIIFQLLNGGIHPFQGITTGEVTAATNDEKAAQGLYPHGFTPDPRIKPRPQSIHASFDDATRQLFDRAFKDRPSDRPSAQNWGDHLNEILVNKQLTRCDQHPYDIRHMRFIGKECPECFLQRLQVAKSPQQKSSVKLPPISSPAFSSPIPPTSQVTKPSKILRWDWILGIGFVIFCFFAFTENSKDSYKPTSNVSSTPSYSSAQGNTQSSVDAAKPKTPWQVRAQEIKDRIAAGTIEQAAMAGLTAANNMSDLNSYLYSGYKPISASDIKKMESSNVWFYSKENKRLYIRLINPTSQNIDKVLLGLYSSCEKRDDRKLLLLNLTSTPLKPRGEIVYYGEIPFGSGVKLSFTCADVEGAYVYAPESQRDSSAYPSSSQPAQKAIEAKVIQAPVAQPTETIGWITAVYPKYGYIEFDIANGKYPYSGQILVSSYSGRKYRISKINGKRASAEPVEASTPILNEVGYSLLY